MYSAEDFNGIKGLAFIARHGVEVRLVDDNKFYVYGFYKSSYVEVDLNAKKILARYNEVTDFADDWTDLVDRLLMLNQEWQTKSAWRDDSWTKLDTNWASIKADYEQLTKK